MADTYESGSAGTFPQSWIDYNAATAYPLMGTATTALPHDVLTDIKLSASLSSVSGIFLSGISYAGGYVTLTVSSEPSGDILAYLPRQLVAPGQVVQLASAVDGVSGQVVFGRGIVHRSQSLTLSADDGRLVPRCLTVVPPNQLVNVQQWMQGQSLANPSIEASGDIRLQRLPVTLDGTIRQATVISLDESTNPRAVHEAYLSSCQRRPESQTCGEPRPIERIAGVSPNCDGEITINFVGGGTVIPLGNFCGVVIDDPTSIREICDNSQEDRRYDYSTDQDCDPYEIDNAT